MSTVVITGARGYIGRALARSLANQGYALRLVSSAATGAFRGRTEATIEHVHLDLRDEKNWCTLLTGADAVIHLSCRTDLRAAEAAPADDRVINVEPVHALVRAAERCGTAVPVIFASSTSIAGDAHKNPVNERTPDRPCSVYDRHKLECENILRAATQRGILRACSLRLATVYGYCDGFGSINPNRGVLNAMISRAMNGHPLTLYGDGSPVRDFTHVRDVCAAFGVALTQQSIWQGTHYIVATGRGCSLAEAFGYVQQEAYLATERKVEIRHVAEPPDLHSIERSDFVGDASVFRTLTGWRAQIDLQSGIRDYFERLLSDLQAECMKSSA
jgi:nucleoside-diphosphate-sugar epimerase